MPPSSRAPRRRRARNSGCAAACRPGEALPPELGRRWSERYGVDILDGLGSTEMLHIFLSNRPDDVKYGTTGKPVPGYDIRLAGDDGEPVKRGEMGELLVKGPTSAVMYWNNREQSRATFLGDWTRSGDKYIEDDDGYFVYCGRRDDMLKVSGIYVSPFEVEGALLTHPDVLEAAVVAWLDGEGLVKPKAFVVLKIRRQGRRRNGAAPAGPRQVRGSRPTNIRAGSNSAATCRRPRPARSSASNCAPSAAACYGSLPTTFRRKQAT